MGHRGQSRGPGIEGRCRSGQSSWGVMQMPIPLGTRLCLLMSRRFIDPCDQLLLRNISPFVIIAGDFNAKSPQCGGERADQRGDQLTQFLIANDLNLLNDPASAPTFSTEYSEAWIDLAIFSSAWRNFSTVWKVSDTPTVSDRYILYSVRSSRL